MTVPVEDMNQLKKLVCEHLDSLAVPGGCITAEGLRRLLEDGNLSERFLKALEDDVLKWFMDEEHSAAVHNGVDGILRRTAHL